MSQINSLKDDIIQSFHSLLSLDQKPKDMEALLGDGLDKRTQVNVILQTNPNKNTALMNDISQIIERDMQKDPNANSVKSKKPNVVTTKDYVQKKKVPSVVDLLNQPLNDSYSGLDDNGKDDLGSKRSLGRITARDLQRSIDNHLDIKADSTTRKKSSKNDLSKGSAGNLLNATMKNSNSLLSDPKPITSLGVTGSQLSRSFDHLSNDELTAEDRKKYKSKLKGSASALMNDPLKPQLRGENAAKMASLEHLPKQKNPVNEIYKATEKHFLKHSKEQLNYEKETLLRLEKETAAAEGENSEE